MEADRLYAVMAKLSDYVKSPSLRHLRDSHSLHSLAKDILQAVDRAGSVWTKWEGRREDVVKAAAACWIPVEDLLAFLNTLPGPALTSTDVKQRLRAVWEEPYAPYPNDDLKAGCVAIYEAEKAGGTEMSAIIGALQEHVEQRWSGKFGQPDNWISCLTAVILPRIRRDHDEANPPDAQRRLQGEGGAGRHQGREDAGRVGQAI